MDLIDDGAEILQQMGLFNENMKIMISISVAVCIIFIVIALLSLKLFNGIFVKVRNHRQNHSSSSNGRDDIVVHTNSNNNTGLTVTHPINFTQNMMILSSSDCGGSSPLTTATVEALGRDCRIGSGRLPVRDVSCNDYKSTASDKDSNAPLNASGSTVANAFDNSRCATTSAKRVSNCQSQSSSNTTPLNVLRNINYVGQTPINRSNDGSMIGNSCINNNIFDGRGTQEQQQQQQPTQHNRNNLYNIINNNRNNITNNNSNNNSQNNSNSNQNNSTNFNRNLVNNIAFVRDTEMSTALNGSVPDGMIVMRTNGLNGLVGINSSIQYHHHHLHHHLHHHHHHGASDSSSLSSECSPTLNMRTAHYQASNNLSESINLRDFSL